MLLTLELMLCTDLKRSLATLGELHIGYGPELIEAIGNYVEKNATTPPGLWVRDYKGQQYLTQSVPALPFFMFLRRWETVPIVGEFLGKNFQYVMSSTMRSEACFSVWIGHLDDPHSVAVAMPLTA
ncbi:hypothetical protein [Klebsiella pneumoniae]|uniref:Uncharacterized protein n=1 Tax=Klebsiella pneumoniae TaxID=573 RepID=A0A378B5Q7_KLEPN|nr:hypothetical protein [Klebsiella pneumoniae]STV29985.1 Uncharacterised protein [Klebsiella pneumoniae]VFS37781.1 Uncharacterised protein [Serratia liquefaciens]